jgi:hypothetical protein
MKQMIVAAMVAGMLASSGVWAESAQQNLMKTCNDDAGKKSLSGDARKAFMKSCLSGDAAAKPAVAAKPVAEAKPAVAATPVAEVKPTAGAVTPQQQRMKDCNAEAASKELKGDVRKTFMSSCLSNKK